jgi:hypothetical protein
LQHTPGVSRSAEKPSTFCILKKLLYTLFERVNLRLLIGRESASGILRSTSANSATSGVAGVASATATTADADRRRAV